MTLKLVTVKAGKPSTVKAMLQWGHAYNLAYCYKLLKDKYFKKKRNCY